VSTPPRFQATVDAVRVLAKVSVTNASVQRGGLASGTPELLRRLLIDHEGSLKHQPNLQRPAIAILVLSTGECVAPRRVLQDDHPLNSSGQLPCPEATEKAGQGAGLDWEIGRAGRRRQVSWILHRGSGLLCCASLAMKPSTSRTAHYPDRPARQARQKDAPDPC